MSNVVRLALPGYNALTDENLDHYSLYADVDNVLIKRQNTGETTISSTNPTTDTISHDLSYIPFFMVYHDPLSNGDWMIMNNRYNLFETPGNVCAVDDEDLLVKNFSGSEVDYSYDIFYDDMDTTGTPEITESKNVFKVARPDKSALSKNPNDYIVHSDLNNFKILKQGTTSKTLTVGVNSFNHGADIELPYKYLCFIKFPDGKTTILGGSAPTVSYDASKMIQRSWCDSTKIYIQVLSGSDFDVNISYIFYGSGKDDTVVNGKAIVACAKEGNNVLESTNPDDFNFHSDYQTLKYFTSGTYSMTVSDSTVYTIAHNLNYTPVVLGFGNDLQATFFPSDSFAILPYYLGQSAVFDPDKDILSSIYADGTNIYLKAYYETNAIGTSKTFKYFYKIFKNDLGLD